ncbi:outer membrane protein transport protein [Aminobacter aminovorans]|uniref:OmpP1/FadL family transporter n=1 Tax=Aminobacter aminovorans TaxID=83263 RepID=UPI00285F194D|nr:outer membrane protein transport protein [Aminobacter aminovorans]MDR7225050.1 long-chain fatty acid transport protein [Aminobacter aminovorans]
MNISRLKALLGATALTIVAAGAAQAGGFARGTADTDILFEEGNFNVRTGVTIVAPQRGYDTITSPLLGGTVKVTDGKYSETYVIPSAAVKFNITDDLRCAGTYTQPFGGGATYGPQAITAGLADGTGTMSEKFTANEFGATCSYKFDLGKGRAWLIGGLFAQNFEYEQVVRFAPGVPGFPAGGTGTLTFDDKYQGGYRIGAAYDIPEIALRAQVLYRSEIEHSPAGGTGNTFVVRSAGGTTLATLPTNGVGTLPQSVELKLQSGIAPGWLAFGSVKWTDWSVLDVLRYNIVGIPGNPRVLEYYWQDGWTVSAGIGHAFTDNISGLVGVTWDQGVSTTEDVHTDTYTLFTGVSLKDKFGGELRLGGALAYMTSGSVAADPTPTTPGPGNTFAYTVGGDMTYAVSASYKVKW